LEQEIEEQMENTAMQKHWCDKAEPLIGWLSSRRNGSEPTNVGDGTDSGGVVRTLKALIV
jgi:hypothetical protein